MQCRTSVLINADFKSYTCCRFLGKVHGRDYFTFWSVCVSTWLCVLIREGSDSLFERMGFRLHFHGEKSDFTGQEGALSHYLLSINFCIGVWDHFSPNASGCRHKAICQCQELINPSISVKLLFNSHPWMSNFTFEIIITQNKNIFPNVTLSAIFHSTEHWVFSLFKTFNSTTSRHVPTTYSL